MYKQHIAHSLIKISQADFHIMLPIKARACRSECLKPIFLFVQLAKLAKLIYIQSFSGVQEHSDSRIILSSVSVALLHLGTNLREYILVC